MIARLKLESGEYDMLADFNRDGEVNSKDAKVYDEIKNEEQNVIEDFLMISNINPR